MARKIIIIFSLLLVVCMSLRSQNDDFGIWSSVEVAKKLKKIELNGEFEFRMQDNLQNIARLSGKVGVEYRIIKPLKIGVAYQYIHFYDVEYSDYQPRNRFITYLQGQQKWGNFNFSLRERVQLTTRDESDRIKSNGKIDTYKMNPDWIWRNRLKIEYDIPKCKITPAVSVESFYQLNNPDGNAFEGMRYTLSGSYKLNKQQSLELFGLYDKEMNVNNPENRYVLGIAYIYSF
ncbi:DUF2490 domain-containing protein [uncultured Proteiniphilum sp.]|uniref:DUF2490 domain-containing protein n=1 Tax=uncultured Proteiniphilum sp. TaxID=497637 RepID=UPI00261ECADE|nr:DUF2490 domain-containing protein [uncultured Proteiniphilum sp.]